MKKITKYNYEAYLLDSLEGTLSPEMSAELLLFFEKHPELKQEVDDEDFLFLKPESVVHTTKEFLKKGSVTADNYEAFLVAEIEGENTKEETINLMTFLNENPKYQKEFELYRKTKLIPLALVFENKKDLKKKETKVIPLFWWVSSAAAVLFAVFILKGIYEQQESPIQMVKNNEKTTIEQKENLTPKNQQEKKIEKTFVAEELKESTKKQVFVKKKINIPSPQKNVIKQELDTVLKVEAHEEENFIAEEPEEKNQQVKITYLDEAVSVPTLAANNPSPKKKKSLFSKIFNSQVRDKVREKIMQKEVNENGEIVAYALNVKGLNLYRKKIK